MKSKRKDKILELKDITVSVEGKQIVNGINISILKGEIAVIMGPNGSGKSTLANSLMGHPKYETKGKAFIEGKDLLNMKPDQRSKVGLFMSFQYPQEIPGVTISNFLRTAINARRKKGDELRISNYIKILNENMDLLHIDRKFASRYVNEGFSGGEKKKMEILQLAMLNPKVAILDETDSGLDIDALKKVCESINTLKKKDKDLTIIIITHYQRMLNYIKPDRIMIMLDGRIVKEGTAKLAEELEKKGYEAYK